jgi:hypothetical protein
MEEKIFRPKTFELSRFSDARIDIIVPFKGSYNTLVSLLENIFKTVVNKYKLNIVYNSSVELGFIENFKKFDFIEFHRNIQPKTLGESINQVVIKSNNPWLITLSPETMPIGPSWLMNLGETIQRLKSQGTKIVSPYLQNDPFFTKYQDDNSSDIILENDDYLPLYNFICHRDLFSNIGMFKDTDNLDEMSKDFYEKMKNKNFSQAISKSTIFKHN